MQNIKKDDTQNYLQSEAVQNSQVPHHNSPSSFLHRTTKNSTIKNTLSYQVSPIEQPKLHTRLTKGNQLCSFYPQNDTPTLLFWTLNLQLLNENYSERKKSKFRLQLQDEQKRTNKATTTKQGWFYISISHLQQNLPWLAHFSKSSQEKFSPWVFLGDQTYFHSHI